MRLRTYYTYILASRPKVGALHIGVTNDLIKRIYEHKSKAAKGFTERYQIDKLVYFEEHLTAEYAIYRGSNLKNGIDSGR